VTWVSTGAPAVLDHSGEHVAEQPFGMLPLQPSTPAASNTFTPEETWPPPSAAGSPSKTGAPAPTG
jgi:hypothetical protein